jgi:thiosulfate/3-mercaptopyruvate sulfurtransferase
VSDFTRQDILVDGDWLQANLNNPGIRIVDCDNRDAYRRAHIPAAVGVRDNYFKDPRDNRFIMEPDQFAQAMSDLGIGDETQVVAYDAFGTLYASRLWWCLQYYGHRNIRILNGGWNRWFTEGRQTTIEEPHYPPATFTPRPNEAVLADAEYIMANLERPDLVVLDVRSDAEWEGKNNRGNKRAGHIPGAVHIEWLNNVTDDPAQVLKQADELRAMFEAAGVTPDKEIVTHCQAGVRAAQAAMTLTLLGYERVRNYDGSFLDWANRDDTPLTT